MNIIDKPMKVKGPGPKEAEQRTGALSDVMTDIQTDSVFKVSAALIIGFVHNLNLYEPVHQYLFPLSMWKCPLSSLKVMKQPPFVV